MTRTSLTALLCPATPRGLFYESVSMPSGSSDPTILGVRMVLTSEHSRIVSPGVAFLGGQV